MGSLKGALSWGAELTPSPPSDLPWPLQGAAVGLQGYEGCVSWPAGFLGSRVEVLWRAVEPHGGASGKDPQTGLRAALVAGEGVQELAFPPAEAGGVKAGCCLGRQRKRAALEAGVAGGA